MPTYEYRCKACSQELEVVQSFTDDALTTCDACGGELRKLFGNVGIAFKGSGFYKNDSRGKAPATAASSSDKGGEASTSNGDKGGSDSGTSSTKDAGSTTKKDAAPASSPTSTGKADAAKPSPTSA